VDIALTRRFYCRRRNHVPKQFTQMAYPNLANKNFANKTFAIGECPPYFRQYTLMTFANWRDSTLLSPIYPHNFRQLARVHYTFANIPQDFRQLARVHCIFFRVTCKLEKSLWTTLIIESSKTYTDTAVLTWVHHFYSL
jgi:hypothetical protein